MKFFRFRVTFFFVLIALPFFSSPVVAWNEKGHMLVAKIAYEKLKPNVREKVDQLIGYLHQEYDDISNFPRAAVWADKLRWQQQDIYTHWHYIDQPLVRDGGSPNVNIIDTDNVMWAINKIRTFLANSKANPYERARSLAFLIHIVGDIHQPLHTVALVTPKFPKGDSGGNDYFVSYKNKRTNLHKIWDDGAGKFEHPYSSDEQICLLELTSQAATLMAHYPPEFFAERLKKTDIQEWLKEGMDIANVSVYSVRENQELDVNYLQKGSAVAEQQVTLAGYRLAEILNQLFA